MCPGAALRSIYAKSSPALFKSLEHHLRFSDAIFRHEQLNTADYAWGTAGANP